MKKSLKQGAAAGVIALSLLCAAPAGPHDAPRETRWYRGNTHTHTRNSDGDSSPQAVARWYRENGYQFVVFTDHDSVTPVEELNALLGAPESFLAVAGEEVTDRFQGAPVHLNGIGMKEAVRPQGGSGLGEMLQRNARAIRASGAIAQINHPNFGWALDAEAMAAAGDARLFELHNAHPLVNNRGGGGALSTEEMWDALLSSGRVIYGVASDDMHHLQCKRRAECVPPGRAWVEVRAPELSREAILAALDAGEFYASTGVVLKSYSADARGIRIELPENASRTAPRYKTTFIGRNGTVLKADESLAPSYEFNGSELYVRARIESSNGLLAWTQPAFRAKGSP